MGLNNIKDNSGARSSKKCLGRGIGSGKGKTCGRGHKGQKARSGVSLNGFEGGQMPIYRRLPKRGFVNILRKPVYELDFHKINALIDKNLLAEGQCVDNDFLIKVGLMPKSISRISVIANGQPKKHVTLSVHKISKKAKELLEKVSVSTQKKVDKPLKKKNPVKKQKEDK
ncbi:MAG: 50S ribosomal protein L15 [Alphaproteobacteria bacterium]